MGTARHAEFLFYPCEMGKFFAPLKPVVGDLTLNTTGCLGGNSNA
jgi:hypothetical protein